MNFNYTKNTHSPCKNENIWAHLGLLSTFIDVTTVICLVWMLPDPLLDVYVPTGIPLENIVLWVLEGKNFT